MTAARVARPRISALRRWPFAVVGLVVALGCTTFFVARDDEALRLADLPQGVSGHEVGERIFFEVEHGSQFAADGLKIGGPARGGLNEHPAEIDGDRVIIDTDEVIEGSSDRRVQRRPEVDDPDWSLPINSGPGSFCRDPVG